MAIRAVGQNIEVTWSHSGRNEKSNTISETTDVILQNVPKQVSSTFVSNCINISRSSSCDMWLECEFWWYDEVAKENVLMCDIAAAVWFMAWNNVLIFPEPSQEAKHATSASVHIVSPNETPRWLSILERVHLGRLQSASFRSVQRVWMPVSEECEQNGLKRRGGYCWGGINGVCCSVTPWISSLASA